ncbi:MmgE/PrpD family protein [Chloroflexota bacterium]
MSPEVFAVNPVKVAKSISETYAEFSLGLRYEAIPTEVIAKAKDHILDTIGCGLAGSTMEWALTIMGMAKHLGGPGEATIIGDGSRVATPNAALACGAACTCLDYDDTFYWGGKGHASRALVPASLTVAEWTGSTGKDLIKATIVGWEISNRLANAQSVDQERRSEVAVHHKSRERSAEQRNHFAAAAEAALLMGLEREQFSSAIALVSCLGVPVCGMNQSHREGADAWIFANGWAALAGVMAATAAQKGMVGPRLIFEGDRGFFKQLDLQELYAPDKLTEGLGTRWYTLDNCIKFYPAGHGIHHWIESLKQVIKEHKVGPDDVEEVITHVPKQRVERHFDFSEQKLNPSPYASRFSLPFILASVMIDGDWKVTSAIGGKVKEPRRLELAKRVHYSLEEDSWLEDNRGSITVKTKDGKSYKAKHPRLLGLPSNPPSHQQIVDKFRENASFVLNKSATEKLVNALENLEQVKNVAEVMRMTAP